MANIVIEWLAAAPLSSKMKDEFNSLKTNNDQEKEELKLTLSYMVEERSKVRARMEKLIAKKQECELKTRELGAAFGEQSEEMQSLDKNTKQAKENADGREQLEGEADRSANSQVFARS